MRRAKVKETEMLNADKITPMPGLPHMRGDRETEYLQAHVDKELKQTMWKYLPKGVTLTKAIERGLVHVLNELNPQAAKKFITLIK